MAKQTAVEWLITEIDAQFTHINIRWKEEMIDKAKEMEKEQIMDAVERGFNVGCYHPEDRSLKNAEHYYNETFGNK